MIAAVVGGTMWFERGQRISFDEPTPAEIAWRIAVAACPDNDNLPYSSSCLEFLGNSSARSSCRPRPKTKAIETALDPAAKKAAMVVYAETHFPTRRS